MTAYAPCPHCDDPVLLNPMGWGRCRSCGSETLRDSQSYDRHEAPYVAASIQHDNCGGDGGEAAVPLGLSL